MQTSERMMTETKLRVMLFAVEFQHLAFFYISLKMVVDMHRTYSCRCAGIDDVARLESEEAAYVAHYFVDLKHHVARHALLHGVSVDVEMEMQRLEVEEFLLWYPFAYGSRTVEALKQVPRHAFCPHLFL